MLENHIYNFSSIHIITINDELNAYRELFNIIGKILKLKNVDIFDESWRKEIIKKIQNLSLNNSNNNNMSKSKDMKMICRQHFFNIKCINNVKNLKKKPFNNDLKICGSEQFSIKNIKKKPFNNALKKQFNIFPTHIKNKKERSQPKDNNIPLYDMYINKKLTSNIKPANIINQGGDLNIECPEKIENLLKRYNRNKSTKNFFLLNK